MANNRNLHRDVALDIISRLPINSIVRFRCVCKSWYSLITDPYFINMHLHRSSMEDGSRCLILNYRSEFSRHEHYSVRSGETFVELTKLEFPVPDTFRIVDSCNGLLCLSRVRGNPFSREIVLWNPAIRKLKTLLDTCGNDSFSDVDCSIAIGFGFVPKINDYKVVQILHHAKDKSCFVPRVMDGIEVYRLSTGAWRSVGADVSCFPTHFFPKAVVNGAVHWMAVKEEETGNSCELIMSFDLEDEVFQEIALPKWDLGNVTPFLSVLACGGSLSLFVHYQNRVGEHWEMWLMEEYGVAGSWAKQFIIRRAEISFPLGFLNNGEVVLVTSNKLVVLYDPKTQQINDLFLYGFSEVLRAVPYMKSLVLLNEGNG